MDEAAAGGGRRIETHTHTRTTDWFNKHQPPNMHRMMHHAAVHYRMQHRQWRMSCAAASLLSLPTTAARGGSRRRVCPHPPASLKRPGAKVPAAIHFRRLKTYTINGGTAGCCCSVDRPENGGSVPPNDSHSRGVLKATVWRTGNFQWEGVQEGVSAQHVLLTVRFSK